jgi:hypothetical protein
MEIMTDTNSTVELEDDRQRVPVVFPDPECRRCHGTGMDWEYEDYGDARVRREYVCQCVIRQLEET